MIFKITNNVFYWAYYQEGLIKWFNNKSCRLTFTIKHILADVPQISIFSTAFKITDEAKHTGVEIETKHQMAIEQFDICELW